MQVQIQVSSSSSTINSLSANYENRKCRLVSSSHLLKPNVYGMSRVFFCQTKLILRIIAGYMTRNRMIHSKAANTLFFKDYYRTILSLFTRIVRH